jgi:catechol 2,3-dioxygenase-like lactoylglutathione lyase family enzyme
MCGSCGTTGVVTFLFVLFLRALIPSPPGEDLLQSNLSELMFVRIANHAGHAGQGRDFFRGTLGVASGDDDLGVGILALHAADGGAGVLVGGGCYRARVEDDHVCIGGGSPGQPALLELALQGSAIRLGGAAAEVFYMKGGHVIHGSAFRLSACGVRVGSLSQPTCNYEISMRRLSSFAGSTPSCQVKSTHPANPGILTTREAIMADLVANEKRTAVRGLGEIALRVNNLDAMQKFYGEVIGLPLMARFPSIAFFKIAEGYGGHTQVLALFDRSQSPAYRGTNAATSTIDHIAFEIPLADFAGERKRLESLGLKVEISEHSWVHWRSLYVTDPDGNLVELVCHDASV